jgi:hypothetical protein
MTDHRPSILFVVLALLCGAVQAADADEATVSIIFDLSAAEAVLRLFDSDHPEKSDVEALLDTPAVRATIAQTGRFDPAATADAYVDTLWRAINGDELVNDPFQFGVVRERLPDIRKTISGLADSGMTITARISARLAVYTPPDLATKTTMYAVLGGTSDGWAPDDEGFYVALRYFRGDIPGLTSLVTHETYHIAQRAFFAQDESDAHTDVANMLVASLLSEGTATLVGDPSLFDGDGRYLQFLQRKHQRNLQRIDQNFALFEALYFRAMHDPDVTPEKVYSIGFTGGWDSPLYFVGFKIAEGLERHLGGEALVELLATSTPTDVLARYVRLCTETGDPDLPQFSPAVAASFANQAH